MKFLSIPFLFLVYATTCLCASSASSSQFDLSTLLTELPPCSVNCIVQGLANVPNALSDPMSTCTNITLQASLSACIQGKCNYTEQAQVAVVNTHLCAGTPIQSRAWPVAIVGLVCGPIAIFAIALRCYARYSATKTLGWDDWLAVATGVLWVPLVVLDCWNGIVNGYGRHYWNIDPLRIVELLKIFFVAEILYMSVTTLVKASIIALYFRVFPSTPFRIAASIVQTIVIANGLAFLIAIVFQCTPIDLAWNRIITHGRCIDINKLAYSAAAISVALDVVILVLPIPALMRLQMGWKKKANLMVMFGLGFIACITSTIRLKYLVTFATSTDQTYDNALPVIWSMLEICVAIICACLPGLRSFLSRYIPSFFAFTREYRDYPSTPEPKGSGSGANSESKGVDVDVSASVSEDLEAGLGKGGKGKSRSTTLVLQNFEDVGERVVVIKPREGEGKGKPGEKKRRSKPTFNEGESKLLDPSSPMFSNFTYSGRFSECEHLSSTSKNGDRNRDGDLESARGGHGYGYGYRFGSTLIERGGSLCLSKGTGGGGGGAGRGEGGERAGRRSSEAMSEFEIELSTAERGVWVNPRFDGGGRVVDYQGSGGLELRDLDLGGGLDWDGRSSEDVFDLEVPRRTGKRGNGEGAESLAESSETSVWVVEGLRTGKVDSSSLSTDMSVSEVRGLEDDEELGIYELRDPPGGLAKRVRMRGGEVRLGGGERWRGAFGPRVQRLLGPLPLGVSKSGGLC